jgi:hypothetical protein
MRILNLLIKKVATVMLALVVWGFAYAMWNIAIANPDEPDIPTRFVALAFAGFLALLGVGLIAEAFGFITSTVVEQGETTWTINISRPLSKPDQSKKTS